MRVQHRIMVAIIVVICSWGCSAAWASDYHDVTEKFFDLVGKDKTAKAIDFVFETSPWLSNVQDQVATVKTQYLGLEELLGDYLRNETLVDTMLNDSYAYVKYFVVYERQPMKIEFQFYRPKDEWVVLNFEYSTDFKSELAELE